MPCMKVIRSGPMTRLCCKSFNTFSQSDVKSDGRRFLRARAFDPIQAKKMFINAQDWRKSAGGVGLDELYKNIDPFDVSKQLLRAVYPCQKMARKSKLSIERNSILNANSFSKLGQCGFTRSDFVFS